MALRIRWCAKEVRCGDREFRFGTKKIYVEKVISIDRGAIYIYFIPGKIFMLFVRIFPLNLG